MGILDLHEAEFLFHSEGLGDASLKVYRFSGHEALSQPFEFEIELVSDDSNLDLQAPIGQAACLTLIGRQYDGNRYKRYIHGVIEEFVQLAAGIRHSRYHARLVPTVKPLHFTRNNRIFQKQSAPDVTNKVLADGNIPAEWVSPMLHEKYGERDYCVQYQESDLDFVQRLWEEEGIFYFFEHERDKDKLTLGDGPHAFATVSQYSNVLIHDQPHLYEESLFEFRPGNTFRPGTALLRDFKFKQPTLKMEVKAESDQFADYRMYYFPGEYVDPGLGQRLAKIRLEEQQCQRSRYMGQSNVRAMLPGHKFTLMNHRRDDCNQEYLIVSVQHEGSQPQALGEEAAGVKQIAYQNRIVSIPAKVTFRPARQIAPPTIPGVQTAVVVGPPGEEIHCDEHGRVKVKFHWDLDQKKDDSSSCWIRVSQPWGGTGQGGMFIPRVGQEVVVQFLEGDPDRPIIVGRVYNGENLVPHGLPTAKNISTIRSASTPGGGGFNEIKFDDTRHSEEVFVHAQKDHNEIAGHNRTRSVGNNESIDVTGFQSTRVGKSRRTFVQLNDTKVIGVDLAVNVNNDHSLIVANNSITTGQTVLVQATKRLKLECNGGYILIDEKGEIHIEGTKVFINCSADNTAHYDEQVRALDDEGKPLSGIPYFIETESGKTYAGTTGTDGKLPRIRTEDESSYTVYWYDEALAKTEEGAS